MSRIFVFQEIIQQWKSSRDLVRWKVKKIGAVLSAMYCYWKYYDEYRSLLFWS